VRGRRDWYSTFDAHSAGGSTDVSAAPDWTLARLRGRHPASRRTNPGRGPRARRTEESIVVTLVPCRIAAFIVAVIVAAASAAASAQYPSRPIRLIVPFPAGSGTDVIARILAQPVSQSLGQPILIDNKPGADGAIAAEAAAKAAPDGYTLLMATSGPMAGLPALKKSLPYNPATDFTPISDVGRFSIFLYTHPSVPAANLKELLDYARANPGKLNYATGNITGIASTAQLVSLGGVKMVHVPYKGEPAGVTDLVAGRVQLMFASPTAAMGFEKEGKIRALAFGLSKRSPAMPDVPTMAEAGMPDFSLISWAALFGPAKMPPDVVERLNREFVAAMRNPDVMAAMEKQMFLLTPSSPADLATFAHVQRES
jgi:tripartite-type tricarboxylate transporter receptor subunit TctC